MPLRDAIAARRSCRRFSSRRFDLHSDADLQLLSDLLWAAFGFISPRRRSAPSSHNWQEIELYVLLPEGAFRYDAAGNSLLPVAEEDLRAASGMQDYVGTAALEIAYVSANERVVGKTGRRLAQAIYADTGFIAENVYLFCAAEGMATVVRAMVPKETLAQSLGLSSTQEITLVQTLGWKAEE